MQHGRYLRSAILPGRNVGEVVVVALSFSATCLVLRAEMTATRLAAMPSVEREKVGKLQIVGEAARLGEDAVRTSTATRYRASATTTSTTTTASNTTTCSPSATTTASTTTLSGARHAYIVAKHFLELANLALSHEERLAFAADSHTLPENASQPLAKSHGCLLTPHSPQLGYLATESLCGRLHHLAALAITANRNITAANRTASRTTTNRTTTNITAANRRPRAGEEGRYRGWGNEIPIGEPLH